MYQEVLFYVMCKCCHVLIRYLQHRVLRGGIRIANGFRLGMKYLTVEQSELLEKLSSELTGVELATMQEILKTFKRPVSVG